VPGAVIVTVEPSTVTPSPSAVTVPPDSVTATSSVVSQVSSASAAVPEWSRFASRTSCAVCPTELETEVFSGPVLVPVPVEP
jgi:hypothetical protein